MRHQTVQLAAHRNILRLQSQLLARFAHRSRAKAVVAALILTAGEADFSRLAAQRMRTLLKKHADALLSTHERQQHCSIPQTVQLVNAGRTAVEAFKQHVLQSFHFTHNNTLF